MNNWLIVILVSTILTVILEKVLVFIYALIKNYIETRTLEFRDIKKGILIAEYRLVESVKTYPKGITILLIKMLANGLFRLVVLIAMIGIFIMFRLNSEFDKSTDNVILFTSIFLISFVTYTTLKEIASIPDLLHKIGSFEKFKEKTIKKLEKLGATLDKEEGSDS